jgi:hypothetical protein
MREIFYETDVTQKIDAAVVKFPRIHDAIAGLEWRLGHRPEEAVARKKLYFIYRQKGFKNLNIPDITVVYRYEGERIHIFGIRIMEAE